MKFAIYMRVSSRGQDTASQEPELKAFAAAKTAAGNEVRWFTDKASGKTMDRPGWNKLQSSIDRGETGVVVCWRLDRLGRTAKGLTALFDDLMARKINLISLRDGVDLNTAAGRLMANVLASVGQFETEVRAERVMAGQRVARSRGKRWGGSREGKEIVTRAKAEQIEAICKLKAERKPIAQIARAVGLSRQTVYKYL